LALRLPLAPVEDSDDELWSRLWLFLSRVGVSNDLSTAVAYRAIQSAPLNGDGRVFVLKRVSGKWEPFYSFTIWMS